MEDFALFRSSARNFLQTIYDRLVIKSSGLRSLLVKLPRLPAARFGDRWDRRRTDERAQMRNAPAVELVLADLDLYAGRYVRDDERVAALSDLAPDEGDW